MRRVLDDGVPRIDESVRGVPGAESAMHYGLGAAAVHAACIASCIHVSN